MNQLVTQETPNFDMMLQDVDQMQAMCKKLMQSKHYQKMGEEGIFALIQKAKSLNMNPMEALNGGLYYVQGKVGMSTEAMNALIRKAGHSITKDPKSNNSICILYGKRADNGDTWTTTFSLEDAKRAGLLKGMFEKYPAVMLFNRAMSMLARQLFPDVIKGAGYTQDELMEIKASNPGHKMETASFDYVEEKISDDQVSELSNMLASCESDVVSRFEGFIKNPPINAQTLNDIPVSQYNTLLNMVKKRYSEAVAKISASISSRDTPQDISFNVEEFEKGEL